MLKAVPAVCAVVAAVTEKCVARSGGGLDGLVPQPLKRHKPQMETKNKNNLFMMCPQHRIRHGSLDCRAILRHFLKRLNAKRVKNESLAGDSENWAVSSGLYRLSDGLKPGGFTAG